MNTETIKLPRGYTAEIATDESPQNPFAEWDCEPSLAVLHDGRLTTYGLESMIGEMCEGDAGYIETMECLALVAGLPCHGQASLGYCQGDYALVLAVALPEWAEKVGAPADSLTGQCKAATSAEETPYTRCALYKGEADDEEGKNIWWLGTLDKDTPPCVGGFPTAAAARAEAASRNWRPIRKQAMDS